MFNCDTCKKPTGPKVSPIPVKQELMKLRRVTYYNTDSEGEPKVTFGTEMVWEPKECPKCAGVKPVVEAVPDHSAHVGLGLAMQAHARKCNKRLDECLVCQRNIKVFASIPLPALNAALTETRVHTGRMSVIALVLTAMIRRTTEQTKDGKQGRRAKNDFLAAFPVLKGYEERGGKL